jgi:hypothetical protein
MIRKLTMLFVPIALLFAAIPLLAQTQRKLDSETCPGPIYNSKDLISRATIIQGLDFDAIYKAFGRGVHAHVILDAVLCRSGRVTDIKVIESSAPDIGEFVAAALTLVRFTPAELKLHSVSQRQRFEFHFNDLGIGEIASKDAEGRIVEAVDIIGHRRLTTQEILSWIRIRPGETFNYRRMMDDLQAVRTSGLLDESRTSAWIEKGVRGGVVVNFEVVELPLITNVQFDGLTGVDSGAVFAAWDAAHLNLRNGQPFGSVAGRSAVSIIKQLLAAHGQPNADVKLLIENVTAQEVKLTFVIR